MTYQDGTVDGAKCRLKIGSERDSLVTGIGDLKVSGVDRLVIQHDPIQRIEVARRGGRLDGLRAAIMRKQALHVPADAPDGLVPVRGELHQVRRPIVPVQVLEAGRVTGHLDDVGVALRAQQVDGFADGRDQARVEDVNAQWVGVIDEAAWRVDLEDGVLADEDRYVLVVGSFLPVVPVVELFEEEGWVLVVVGVPHAAGGDGDIVVQVLVVGRADERDVRVHGFDAVV